MVPNARSSLFCRPNTPAVQTKSRENRSAARAIGQKNTIVKGEHEARNQCGLFDRGQSVPALRFVGGGAFLTPEPAKVVGLAALQAIPASMVEHPLSLPAD
jgi:hypothetical protein